MPRYLDARTYPTGREPTAARRAAAIVFAALATVFLAGGHGLARVDPLPDTTYEPASDPMQGVTTESLGSMRDPSDPSRTLMLLRVTLQPGVSIPVHASVGEMVLLVESGRLGTTFEGGHGIVARAAHHGNPPLTVSLAGGQRSILEAGDSLAYDGRVVHTLTNAGEQPLVLIASALLANDRQTFVFHR